jgi:hypothetical protein
VSLAAALPARLSSGVASRAILSIAGGIAAIGPLAAFARRDL